MRRSVLSQGVTFDGIEVASATITNESALRQLLLAGLKRISKPTQKHQGAEGGGGDWTPSLLSRSQGWSPRLLQLPARELRVVSDNYNFLASRG